MRSSVRSSYRSGVPLAESSWFHENGFESFDAFDSWRRSERFRSPGAVFRGHANARWSLESTLTRSARAGFAANQPGSSLDPEKFSIPVAWFDDHVVGISSALPVASQPEASGWPHPGVSSSGARELVEFRHAGAVSPLLDWTQSPYVAAWFAFESAPVVAGENVAIWILCSPDGRALSLPAAWPEARPETWPEAEKPDPFIVDLDHQPATLLLFGRPELEGEAQARQSALHTAAVLWTHDLGAMKPLTPQCMELAYYSHEAVLEALVQQCGLSCFKCLIPSLERLNVIKHLEEMGIDAYKIYGTPEARICAAVDRAVSRHWQLRQPGSSG